MFILKLKENIIAIIIISLTFTSLGIVDVIEISASSYSLLSSGITLDEDVPPKNKSTAKIQNIYPTQPNAEMYRFNNIQPNDLNQVNETEILLFFHRKILTIVGG